MVVRSTQTPTYSIYSYMALSCNHYHMMKKAFQVSKSFAKYPIIRRELKQHIARGSIHSRNFINSFNIRDSITNSLPSLQRSSFSSQNRDCWQCGHSVPRDKIYCPRETCGAIQTISQDDINYFDLFGIKTSYYLDEKQLENAYKNLQKQLHPDKFATASQDAKNASTQTSATANHAYITLKDSLSRAEYMLWLFHKQRVYESEIARLDEKLMMEMFEWRERVDDAKNDPKLRREVAHDVKMQLIQCQSTVASIIMDPSMTSLAMIWTTRMKYFSKMIEELAEHDEY